MTWKNIPKTKIAKLLNVHRNTVGNLLKSGELKGTSFPEILDYVKVETERQTRKDILAQIQGLIKGELT